MIKVVASVLIKRDEKYLIIKDTMDDMWMLPFGVMLSGENLTETVKRGAFEQIGITPYPTGIKTVYSDKLAAEKSIVNVIFGATDGGDKSDVKLCSDFYDFRWLTFQELEKLEEDMHPVLWNWIKEPNFHEFFNDVQVLPPYNPVPEPDLNLPDIGANFGRPTQKQNRSLYDYCRERGVDLRDLSHRAGAALPDKLPNAPK